MQCSRPGSIVVSVLLSTLHLAVACSCSTQACRWQGHQPLDFEGLQCLIAFDANLLPGAFRRCRGICCRLGERKAPLRARTMSLRASSKSQAARADKCLESKLPLSQHMSHEWLVSQVMLRRGCARARRPLATCMLGHGLFMLLLQRNFLSWKVGVPRCWPRHCHDR